VAFLLYGYLAVDSTWLIMTTKKPNILKTETIWDSLLTCWNKSTPGQMSQSSGWRDRKILQHSACKFDWCLRCCMKFMQNFKIWCSCSKFAVLLRLFNVTYYPICLHCGHGLRIYSFNT